MLTGFSGNFHNPCNSHPKIVAYSRFSTPHLMKSIKSLILLSLLALTTLATAQQIRIPDTKVSFSFPNNGWKYLETNKVNDNVVVYIYSYSKDYVVDNNGDTVIPFMRIYVRKNYFGSIYNLAFSRFNAQPFQSLDEYSFLDGLGYWGGYTSEADGKDYLFRMVYFKDGNTALEIRLETTRDNYDAFDEEFKAILNTVKKSQK